MVPPFQKYPLVLRLLLMFSMFVFNISVVSFLALTLAQTIFSLPNAHAVVEGTFTNQSEVNAFLFIQGLSSLGGFALTALMFAVLEAGEFKHRLRVVIYPSARLIVMAVAAIIVSQFFIEFLVSINQSIVLPESLQFLKEYQKKSEAITEAMMNFTGIGQFILVSIVVAVIPAIAEEFFFRGLMLGALLRAGKHPLVSILFTGLVFSVSHFGFDNILAIFILGSFLGYLFYISGSLWLPIAAHFTNNFLAVLLKYLFNLGYISSQVAEAKTPIYITLISLVVFSLFIFLFYKWKNPDTFVETEETVEEPVN